MFEDTLYGDENPRAEGGGGSAADERNEAVEASGTKSGVFELFARIEWLLHRYRQQRYRSHGPMGDPHRGQGRILTLLKMQPEISQKDLSYLLDMRPQSLGELLAKLEKSGYITRTPMEEDRRVQVIRLTDQGMEAADSIERPNGERLLDCLTEEEQEKLREYLVRIVDSIEARFDGEQPDDGEDWRGFRGRGPNPRGRGYMGEGGPDPRGGFYPPHPGMDRCCPPPDGRFGGPGFGGPFGRPHGGERQSGGPCPHGNRVRGRGWDGGREDV